MGKDNGSKETGFEIDDSPVSGSNTEIAEPAKDEDAFSLDKPVIDNKVEKKQKKNKNTKLYSVTMTFDQNFKPVGVEFKGGSELIGVQHLERGFHHLVREHKKSRAVYLRDIASKKKKTMG